MVPQDRLLRKIDAAIDFKKIYEFVEELYCEDNGRPSVIWQEYVENAEHVRHMAVYKELYRLRKDWVKLKFVAMNLKKLATWKWNGRHPTPDGAMRSRLRKNTPDFSLLFPFVFLFTNQYHAQRTWYE